MRPEADPSAVGTEAPPRPSRAGDYRAYRPRSGRTVRQTDSNEDDGRSSKQKVPWGLINVMISLIRLLIELSK